MPLPPPGPVPAALTPLQRVMLRADRFHVDGWTSVQGREAAADLESRGLVESFGGGDSQYTAVNYRATEAGRAALLAAGDDR